MKFFTLIALVGCVFYACNTSSNQNQTQTSVKGSEGLTINRELEDQAPVAQTFTIDPEKGGYIETSDGSKILVPAKAFVDASGNTIKESIKVDFTAYKGALDIIASGIPMQAANADKLGQFVSDGMFKLEAESQGKMVKIAKDKAVEVFQPSDDSKTNFNSWYFDQQKGSWVDLGKRPAPCDDKKIAEVAKNLGIKIAKKPEVPETQAKGFVKAYDPSKTVLDLTFDKKNYPELTGYSKIMWQYTGNNAAQDPDKNPNMYDGNWSNVSLKRINNDDLLYTLSFKAGGKSFTTTVTPALTGKDLEKAKAALQKADKQKSVIEVTEASQKANAKLYNAFKVNQIGIYNCDRFYMDPEAVELTPKCEYDGIELTENHVLYVLMDNKKNVIQYNAANYKMKLNPEIVDGIITVVGSGVIAAVEPAAINELRRTKGSGKIQLVFKKLAAKAGQKLSLKESIDQI